MPRVLDDICRNQLGHQGRCIVGDQEYTYRDLGWIVSELSGLVSSQVRSGSRIALCLPLSAEYLAALLAVSNSNCISVLTSPFWTKTELERVIDDSEPAAILGFDIQSIKALGFEPVGFCRAMCVARSRERPVDQSGPDDAMIIYTSGSTSAPKGVVLTHAGLSASARAVADFFSTSEGDVVPVFTPPCHVYAVSQVLTHLLRGAAMRLYPHGLMYPHEIVRDVQRLGFTGMSANPTILKLLFRASRGPLKTSLRYVKSGGQPLRRDIVIQFGRVFPGVRLASTYGCTENSSRITSGWIDPGETPQEEVAHVGPPLKCTSVEIFDDCGQVVSDNSVGEVVLSGRTLFRCYWRNAELTRRRLVNGRFFTGDRGYWGRDGSLRLTGRGDLIVNVGHEKVSPEECEEVLLRLPGVEDAAVFKVSDDLLGEAIEAAVVLTYLAEADDTDVCGRLLRQMRSYVSGGKVPKRIHLVTEIPRLEGGKIDRKALESGLN